MELSKVQQITLEQVEQVYIGKAGACSCGCKGEYTPSRNYDTKPSSVYPPTLEQSKLMLHVLRTVQAADAQGTATADDEMVYCTINKKDYVVHLKVAL